MTLVATANCAEGAKQCYALRRAGRALKLGVSFYQYVYDRISGAHPMPSLADLIREQAKELNLGASWQPP